MKFRPELPMHDRYEVAHGFLTPGRRRGGRHDLPAGERVLPVGVQLLREPRRGRRGASDRLRQRLPGRRADVAALLLPVGDDGAGALDDVHAGHRPQAAPGPRHGRLLRDRRPRRPVLRRQAGAYAGSPTTTSRPSATSTSARAGCATSTRSCWSGSTAPDFDALLVETVRATYPAAEHDRFVAHFRGLVGLWVTDTKAALAARRSARVEVQVGGEPLGHLDHPLQVVVPDDDPAVAHDRRPPVAPRRADGQQVDVHDVAAVRGTQGVEAVDVGDPAVAVGPLEDAAGVVPAASGSARSARAARPRPSRRRGRRRRRSS